MSDWADFFFFFCYSKSTLTLGLLSFPPRLRDRFREVGDGPPDVPHAALHVRTVQVDPDHVAPEERADSVGENGPEVALQRPRRLRGGVHQRHSWKDKPVEREPSRAPVRLFFGRLPSASSTLPNLPMALSTSDRICDSIVGEAANVPTAHINNTALFNHISSSCKKTFPVRIFYLQ